MNLLLDTNILLWWLSGADRLTDATVESIRDEANDVAVSAVSIWEISIKQSLGKITIDADLGRCIEEQAFRELSITGRHTVEVGVLPWHHRDPFDRLLVAQARCEGMTLVTGDRQLVSYAVPAMLC